MGKGNSNKQYFTYIHVFISKPAYSEYYPMRQFWTLYLFANKTVTFILIEIW